MKESTATKIGIILFLTVLSAWIFSIVYSAESSPESSYETEKSESCEHDPDSINFSGVRGD